METVLLPHGDGHVRLHRVRTPRPLATSEGGFAVLRVDLRGTGSSGGHLPDEYSDIERDDLTRVIRWIAAQPWSTGRIGMFGTSYSGFNSLHMAMEGLSIYMRPLFVITL